MQYTFHNPKTGLDESVGLTRWVWGVRYENEEMLFQYDRNGVFHQVGEIDQDCIKNAFLFSTEDPNKRIILPWKPGMKLIHKYRMIRPMHQEEFVQVFIFGYKYENSYTFFYVLPNDFIIASPTDDVDLTRFLEVF